METSEFSYANFEQGLAELTRALEEKAPKVLSTLFIAFQLSGSRTPSPCGRGGGTYTIVWAHAYTIF
jgi:hypothetical protein